MMKLEIKICTACGDFTPMDRTSCLNCRKREMNVYEISDVKLIHEIRES